MSKATKKKHVTREVLEDLVTPGEGQQIVKVIGGRGNNLHEVQSANGECFLCSMPTKFRRNVWIKRGDYVIVETIAEGHKVTAEIIHILYPVQIKHLKEQKLWPMAFDSPSEKTPGANATETAQALQKDSQLTTDSEQDSDDDLFVNTNRPPPIEIYDSDSSDEDDSQTTT
ncbi:probable RNA-binding protein EIF1AD [Dysidea avara]|uniref:probable RNA-binding protein EIF1AD n=1 Tax=Dysidea avara TaxID=196820 RepID=UPI0033330583